MRAEAPRPSAKRGPMAEPLNDNTRPTACGHCGSRSLFSELVKGLLDFACLACGWRKTTTPAQVQARRGEAYRLALADPIRPRGRPRKRTQ